MKIASQTIVEIALSMYDGEPCRICGKPVVANTAVFAGHSDDNESRSACKSCWDKNLPKNKWVYPKDSTD